MQAKVIVPKLDKGNVFDFPCWLYLMHVRRIQVKSPTTPCPPMEQTVHHHPGTAGQHWMELSTNSQRTSGRCLNLTLASGLWSSSLGISSYRRWSSSRVTGQRRETANVYYYSSTAVRRMWVCFNIMTPINHKTTSQLATWWYKKRSILISSSFIFLHHHCA